MENQELVSANVEEQQKNLPNWKNKPTTIKLKEDLTSAKSVADDAHSNIKGWLNNLMIEGSAKIKVPKGNSSIQPKLIRKQAEWRYGALSEPFLSTSDLFNVSPVTWEDRDAAEQNQLLLNHQFNTVMDKQAFIDEYVRTAVDEGTVILRTGWEYEDKEIEVEVPIANFIPDESFVPTLQEVGRLQQESPSEYAQIPDELKQAFEMSQADGVPYRPEIVEYRKEKETQVITNKPTVEICDYRNVIIDPTCQGDISKASFVIYSFETSMAVLKKDPKYVNLDAIALENASILGEPDHGPSNGTQTFNFADKTRKKFVVFEYWGYWDIHDDGTVVPIVVSWVGNTIIRMEENPFPDGELPFVVVQYLPVRKSIYGEPDGALLEDNQKVIGALTRGMIDIMAKSANGQTGMRKDMLDASNRRKYLNGEDYEFNGNVDPRQGVHMHTYPEIPQSALTMLQLHNMDAESLTGVKSYTQGISSSSLGDVAAGIRGAMDAASKRELGILRRLSTGVIAVARKFISMNAVFLSDEEVIRVTNDQFVAVRKDDLPGQFDLALSISTAEEDNNKAEQLAFMMQTLGNTMPFEITQMLLGDIARLRKMPDLSHKIETFKPEPDPVQQELAALELELKKAELQFKQVEIAEMQSRIPVNAAKAAAQQASADKASLDFVEQESGVTQERDLQKQGAQARAQTEMKIVDHQLKSQENERSAIRDYVLDRNKPK